MSYQDAMPAGWSRGLNCVPEGFRSVPGAEVAEACAALRNYSRPPGHILDRLYSERGHYADLRGAEPRELRGAVFERCVQDRADWLGENGFDVGWPVKERFHKRGLYILPRRNGRGVLVYQRNAHDNRYRAEIDCLCTIGDNLVLWEAKLAGPFYHGEAWRKTQTLMGTGAIDGRDYRPSFVLAVPETHPITRSRGIAKFRRGGGYVAVLRDLTPDSVSMLASEFHVMLNSEGPQEDYALLTGVA